MDLAELRVFLTVATERSFSRAAAKLHRTQPAVSQAVRRLEDEIGERLFDRSSKDGTLTEAGRVLREYAERLIRLSEPRLAAQKAPRPTAGSRARWRQRGGRSILLPLIALRRRCAFSRGRGRLRRPARRRGENGRPVSVVTVAPTTRGPRVGGSGDELSPRASGATLAGRDAVSMEFSLQAVIAHNDPSPARSGAAASELQHCHHSGGAEA